MATMIPGTIDPDNPSSAELTLFPMLRDRLPSDFTVFHSFPLLGKTDSGSIKEGEIDFLVYSPSFGFLVLEAKSGVITYDGNTGAWCHNGHPCMSPYAQAQRAKYLLIDTLAMKVRHFRDISVGYAVCLPEVFQWPTDLPPGAGREVTILGCDLQNLASRIEEIMVAFKKQDFLALTADQVAQVTRCLLPQVELGMTLADSVGRAERRIFALTEEQCHLLDFISAQRKALIKGCAGSGKTVMALRKASELAKSGLSVLLLAFNERLCGSLKKAAENVPNLTVASFHGFCSGILAENGRLPPSSESPDYYERVIPDAFMQLLADKPLHFDAVIVDEGQDFKSDYWLIVNELTKPEGYFYIFYDPDQNVFGGDMAFPIDGEPFILDRNCRNTLQICRALAPMSASWEVKARDGGAEGAEVTELRSAEPSQRLRWLSQILHRLVIDEKLLPSQVKVIGAHDISKTCIPRSGKVGSFMVGKDAGQVPNSIEYLTYMKFKGCEADAVILLDVDVKDPRWSKSGLYTAISRAKHSLSIIRKD